MTRGSTLAVRCTLALAVAAGALVGACAAPLPSTELPPARFIMPARGLTGLRDYRGVVDFRMRESGLDQAAAAELALKAQVDFVFLADRVDSSADYGTTGFTNQILFIAGASFPASQGGEVLGFNLTAPVDPKLGAKELISAIRDQDAIAAVAGASQFASADDYALADAIEVYDFGRQWSERSGSSLYLRALFLSADRFFSGFDVRPDAELAAFDRMAAGAHATLLAGLGAPGETKVIGMNVGNPAQRMLVFTTHVLARERQVGPVVDALRRGNSYVSFDILGYVPNFAFYAQHGDERVMMGDEVELAQGVALRTELHDPAERIVLLANGVEVASVENATQLEFAPKVPAAYRIEAYREGLPWIYSNPVYVR